MEWHGMTSAAGPQSGKTDSLICGPSLWWGKAWIYPNRTDIPLENVLLKYIR